MTSTLVKSLLCAAINLQASPVIAQIGITLIASHISVVDTEIQRPATHKFYIFYQAKIQLVIDIFYLYVTREYC